MEDVLELYAEPYDPKRPVVCFDEKSFQLLEETRVSQPVRPGQPALVDYEYRRKGTANIFSDGRTGGRMARGHGYTTTHQVGLCGRNEAARGRPHPAAERIRVVMDNLSTHTPAGLYDAFPPA